MNGCVLNTQSEQATTMRDPNELHKFMMGICLLLSQESSHFILEDIAKMIKTVPTPPNHVRLRLAIPNL